MTHGTGFLPEPSPSPLELVGSLTRGARVRLRAGSLPPEGGFPVSPDPMDQGLENSCTGHFVASAVEMLTGRNTSPAFPYYWARARDLGPDAIADIGARPSALVQATGRHGTCPFEDWHRGLPTYDVNEAPPAMARARAQRMLVELVPIHAFGDSLVDRLCDSLHLGQPVGIVVRADDEFSTAPGGLVGPERGPGGLHIITGYRYRTRGDGRREILCLNSWGHHYALGGSAWLSPDRVGQSSWCCFVRRVSWLD